MILDEILIQKRKEVKYHKEQLTLAELIREMPAKEHYSFKNALKNEKGISLIAEVKKASPSKGVLLADFDPVKLAKTYEKNGAAAISVLTDVTFFQGNLSYLKEIRENVRVPLLRKDFIIDYYQIYEARVYGADAILLIAAILEKKELELYIQLARDLGLDALVEVHTMAELQTALSCGAEIIGINNRNLNTFETSLKTTLDLAKAVPKNCLLVSESGIFSADDVRSLAKVNVDAVLVGEALVTSPQIDLKVQELVAGGKDVA